MCEKGWRFSYIIEEVVWKIILYTRRQPWLLCIVQAHLSLGVVIMLLEYASFFSYTQSIEPHIVRKVVNMETLAFAESRERRRRGRSSNQRGARRRDALQLQAFRIGELTYRAAWNAAQEK
jgi:hypothetical protein